MQKYAYLLIIILTLVSCSETDQIFNSEKTSNTTSGNKLAVGNTDSQILLINDSLVPNAYDSFLYNESQNLYLNNKLKYAVKTYRITYSTINCDGATVSASGTAIIPQKPTNGDDYKFSVLSYQHGTKFDDASVYNTYNDINLYRYASAGFITVVPDYLGYNKSGSLQHPYFMNSNSTRVVRDMVSASLELTNSQGISNNGKLFLHGYSEGANVTIALLKSVEENPLKNLMPTATLACSGAYALVDQGAYMDSQYAQSDVGTAAVATSLMSYMIYGFDKNIQKSNNMYNYFNAPYAQNIPGLLSGNTSAKVATELFGYYMFYNRNVLSYNFRTNNQNPYRINFINFLRNNTLTTIPWGPKSLVKLKHGTIDNQVPILNSAAMYNIMRAFATDPNKITSEPLVGSHESTNTIGIFAANLLWFDQLRVQ